MAIAMSPEAATAAMAVVARVATPRKAAAADVAIEAAAAVAVDPPVGAVAAVGEIAVTAAGAEVSSVATVPAAAQCGIGSPHTEVRAAAAAAAVVHATLHMMTIRRLSSETQEPTTKAVKAVDTLQGTTLTETGGAAEATGAATVDTA